MKGLDINQLVLLGIGAMQFLNAAIAYIALRSSKRAETNIATVEKATNSMKDALVAATAKASFAEGKAAERTNPGAMPIGGIT